MTDFDHLTREQLVALLRRREREARYGLVWERGEIDPDKALNDDFVALDPDEGLSAGPAPWRNLIIEGDNWDALRFLRMTHAGKVKCIYIDPPYNTGNRDFVYNDHFFDRTNRFRHSVWLEFMYRRLLLARDLLSTDGAIFVSIDDNELFPLGMLMNRVFGEKNFVANCIWQKRYTSAADHKTIAPMHEYVMVYRTSETWQRKLLPRPDEKDRQYRYHDERGTFRPDNYTCNKNADERPNLYYAIIQPNTGDEIWPKTTAVWRFSKDSHERNVRDGLVYWGKDGTGKVPAFKRYKHMLRHADGIVPNSWWPFEEVGHTDAAKKELLDILSEHKTAFSTPKPVRLMERILRIATGPDDLVLDFFAGSGTTAQAVLKLNAEDGGRRRYILVSSTEATEDAPDKNLCRDVCAERVRRVIGGYRNKKGEEVPGLGGDFVYLRTRLVPRHRLGLRLEHAQIWTVLLLLHDHPLSPWSGSFGWSIREGNAIGYLSDLRRETVKALSDKASLHRGETVIYSWSPERLADAVLGASVRPIPESLLERFGRTASRQVQKPPSATAEEEV